MVLWQSQKLIHSDTILMLVYIHTEVQTYILVVLQFEYATYT